ncbi:hypothetical protein Tsubulata_038523 [Turnera subulata]|uniref:Uncharacterized protein n=1 Tax=Turnera subulata TaxID=218843 RepID=A0A9Q0FN43_9ROSI|nr:hypothetical protein Tsubulata_038523 [Turnera subulata]
MLCSLICFLDWEAVVFCLLLLHRSLRPYRISPKRFVPAHIELPDWAVDIAREVLDAAAQVIRPGVTTDENDRVAHEATIKAGMLTAFSGFLCASIVVSLILGCILKRFGL